MTTGVCGLGPHEVRRLDEFLDELAQETTLEQGGSLAPIWNLLTNELLLSARPELRAAFVVGLSAVEQWRTQWMARPIPQLAPGMPLSESDPIENVILGVTGLDFDVFWAGVLKALGNKHGLAGEFVQHIEERKASLEGAYRELVGTEGPSVEREAAELVNV